MKNIKKFILFSFCFLNFAPEGSAQNPNFSSSVGSEVIGNSGISGIKDLLKSVDIGKLQVPLFIKMTNKSDRQLFITLSPVDIKLADSVTKKEIATEVNFLPSYESQGITIDPKTNAVFPIDLFTFYPGITRLTKRVDFTLRFRVAPVSEKMTGADFFDYVVTGNVSVGK